MHHSKRPTMPKFKSSSSSSDTCNPQLPPELHYEIIECLRWPYYHLARRVSRSWHDFITYGKAKENLYAPPEEAAGKRPPWFRPSSSFSGNRSFTKDASFTSTSSTCDPTSPPRLHKLICRGGLGFFVDLTGRNNQYPKIDTSKYYLECTSGNNPDGDLATALTSLGSKGRFTSQDRRVGSFSYEPTEDSWPWSDADDGEPRTSLELDELPFGDDMLTMQPVNMIQCVFYGLGSRRSDKLIRYLEGVVPPIDYDEDMTLSGFMETLKSRVNTGVGCFLRDDVERRAYGVSERGCLFVGLSNLKLRAVRREPGVLLLPVLVTLDMRWEPETKGYSGF